MYYTLYADGGARGNPGHAGAGAVAFDHLGKRIVEVSDYLGETTNNVAEYEALLRGLRALLAEVGEEGVVRGVSVYMDSELIIKQLRGVYKVKHPNLIPRYMEVRNLIARSFPKITFTHVRREQNADADALANRAMDERQKLV